LASYHFSAIGNAQKVCIFFTMQEVVTMGQLTRQGAFTMVPARQVTRKSKSQASDESGLSEVTVFFGGAL
jgi:hypothetical protein